MSVEYSQWNPLVVGILLERVFKQYWGATGDEKRVEELIPQLENKLDAYETILGR